MAAEEAEAGVEVVVDVGVKDKEEVVEEDQEVKVKEIKDLGVKVKVKGKISTTPTKPLVMLTSPHSRPASGTGPSGSQLISVWSQGPARGKMCGYPSPTNETGTSPELVKKQTTNTFMICCTTKNRKYMPLILKKCKEFIFL